ncbi:immunoglobulin lambda-1 light chain isoform X2 [Pogona vitticeps]
MSWVPLLSLLLAMWCTGANSQFTVSQPPSASVSPGNTAKLSCTISSSGKTVYWYQQKPGNAPRYLLYYYSESSKGQGSEVPSRFSGSKDSSGKIGYLTISGALAEDEAVYYCAAWDSNAYVFGGGTYLNVLGQPPAPPKVHLFPPSQEEIKIKGKGTLVCLVDGFHPKTVQVNWQADGKAISSGVQTSEPAKQGDKYMATSYLTVTPSDWENHQRYSCIVTHEGKTYEEVVKPSACP